MGPVLGPHTHTPCAQETRAADPRCLPQGRVAWRGRASNPKRPSLWQKDPLLAPSRHPCGALRTAGHASQWASGQVPIPAHPHPEHVISTPTACPEDVQPREDERLGPDNPHESTRRPTVGSPPATPTARNASSQERGLSGRFWALTPTPPTPTRDAQRGPTTCCRDA